jgi:hypothetical protein
MLRSVVGVLTGIVLAGAVIAFGEAISHLLVPPPAGMNAADRESIAAAMASMSRGSFLGVLAAWGIGTFIGAGAAALVARQGRVACAVIVGCAVMAAATLNMLTIPHPAWFWAASLAIVVPTAWLAGRLATAPLVR